MSAALPSPGARSAAHRCVVPCRRTPRYASSSLLALLAPPTPGSVRSADMPSCQALSLAQKAAIPYIGPDVLPRPAPEARPPAPPQPGSALQRDASWLIHGIHHDYPWDRDRLVMPPTVTALIAAGVWFGFRWLGAAEHAWMAGMVGGYVWYDLTHYYLHHAAPTTSF